MVANGEVGPCPSRPGSGYATITKLLGCVVHILPVLHKPIPLQRKHGRAIGLMFIEEFNIHCP